MYRLLLKIHNQTGLKYLCKTKTDDYIKYPGSGKYWKWHLKVHGKDISTELLFETEDLEEFKKVAFIESINRDIVKSEEYANLVIENGIDGSDYWTGKKNPHTLERNLKNNPMKPGMTNSTSFKSGKDHRLFGIPRPDVSERNRKDNPMTSEKASRFKRNSKGRFCNE